MYVLTWFAVGIVIGFASAVIALSAKCCGSLRIDTSDPDGPYLFLELDKSVKEVSRKPYVTFRVKPENYISHK